MSAVEAVSICLFGYVGPFEMKNSTLFIFLPPPHPHSFCNSPQTVVTTNNLLVIFFQIHTIFPHCFIGCDSFQQSAEPRKEPH